MLQILGQSVTTRQLVAAVGVIQLLATSFEGRADVPAIPAHAVAQLNDLTASLEKANKAGDCVSANGAARQILKFSPHHLEALLTIEKCTRRDASQNYAKVAREMFQESTILSLVPELLEMANLKELVPIIREVETKGNKSVADYLMLTELYDKLGQPDKEIRALEEAIAVDPNDPRPKLLLASKKFDAGDRKGAQALFREYLFNAEPHPGRAYMLTYVAAMTYPMPVTTAILVAIWGLGALVSRRMRSEIEAVRGQLRGKVREYFFLISAFIPVLLAGQFWSTGAALPFGVLMMILASELLVLAWPYLWRYALQPAWYGVSKAIGILMHGVKFARILSKISSGWRILIALSALFVMGTIAPMIKVADIRYAVTIMCSLLFYGTVGSLLVTVLRSSSSLQTSMRVIGVAATIPFIMSYVVSHWNDIGAPIMYARLPSAGAINGLVNYMIFWGVSVALAMHISKILADALIEPVREMMAKIRAIEGGDFAARVQVLSKDEVGSLAKAVNSMAEGLARREYVEKTFSRYVDEKVAKKILSGGEDEVSIKGQRMDATILFADIRGFTAFSESVSPEEVVSILNEYFSRMVAIIRHHGGVIDKYIGDCMLCVWGVPTFEPDGARRAVEAANAMVHEMTDFTLELQRRGHKPFGIGIGINFGAVVAGSLGSSDRMEYTVIGDVVNTAQRAESVAKPQQVLITDSVYAKVRDFVQATPIHGVKVKGKAEALTFWEVHEVSGALPEVYKAA